MERVVMWAAVDTEGIEHLYLRAHARGIIARGTLIRVEDTSPVRVEYAIRCDPAGHIRTLRVRESTRELRLSRDQAGRWSADGEGHVPALDGCMDVDISATPFTNTLPIRRLRLRPGDSAVVRVVYVSVPELSYSVAVQRYTCLEVDTRGTRYAYESLTSGYRTEFCVDPDGLVLDYPGLFRRLAHANTSVPA